MNSNSIAGRLSRILVRDIWERSATSTDMCERSFYNEMKNAVRWYTPAFIEANT